MIKTFVSTTTRYNYQVQIATTNINIVCNSDTESVAWNVALDNGSSYSLNEHTIAINSFSSQKDGVYQCNFGNGVNISISLKGSGKSYSHINLCVYIMVLRPRSVLLFQCGVWDSVDRRDN